MINLSLNTGLFEGNSSGSLTIISRFVTRFACLKRLKTLSFRFDGLALLKITQNIKTLKSTSSSVAVKGEFL